MKTCPFCAEEIKPEAIKCRYCHSLLRDADRGDPEEEEGRDAGAAKPAPERAPAAAAGEPGSGRARAREARWLFRGPVSWRAFLAHYLLIVLASAAAAFAAGWVTGLLAASGGARVVAVLGPLVFGLAAFAGLNLHRRARVVWISTTSIERRTGILRKHLEVIELRRCRDLRYHQTFGEQILGIARIEVIPTGDRSPLHLEGLAISRPLFERIRDAVQDARES